MLQHDYFITAFVTTAIFLFVLNIFLACLPLFPSMEMSSSANKAVMIFQSVLFVVWNVTGDIWFAISDEKYESLDIPDWLYTTSAVPCALLLGILIYDVMTDKEGYTPVGEA